MPNDRSFARRHRGGLLLLGAVALGSGLGAMAAAFAGVSIPDHPRIAPWRTAYRAFGAKPKDHPSSIENLVRRAAKGQRLPHVSKLVDLYNAVSLRFCPRVDMRAVVAVRPPGKAPSRTAVM